MAMLQNYPIHLPLVYIAMNLADLCPVGIEKYEEFLVQGRTYQKFGRVHMMLFMIRAHEKFLEHLQDCELCMPMEELSADD